MDQIAHHQDTVIHAETGSGKTLGYLVPLLSRLDPGVPLQLLILLPSRELALQVALDVHRLVEAESPLNVALVVGGVSTAEPHAATMQMQLELANEVESKRAEVLIATPQALSRVLRSGPLTHKKPGSLSTPEAQSKYLERQLEVRLRQDRLLLRDQQLRSHQRLEGQLADGEVVMPAEPPPPLSADQLDIVLKKGWADSRLDWSTNGGSRARLAGTLDADKLLLALGSNLDAIVLDEVDALLPKPVLNHKVDYYRRKDWATADRLNRRRFRGTNKDSSPAAKLVGKLLRAVQAVRDDSDDGSGVRRGGGSDFWKARREPRVRRRQRPVHLVAASATVSKGTLKQLKELFGRPHAPAVVGVDGKVVAGLQPGGITTADGRILSLSEARKEEQRAWAEDVLIDAVVDGHLARVQAERRAARGAARKGGGGAAAAPFEERPGARGVARVRVPDRIRHCYRIVPDGGSKVEALVECLRDLRPSRTLAILPDTPGVSPAAWLEALQTLGMADAALLHVAMGFPTQLRTPSEQQQEEEEEESAVAGDPGRKESLRGTRALLDRLSRVRSVNVTDDVEARLQQKEDGSTSRATRLLLTTERSARGIDLPGLDCVALLFCPSTSDSYVHLAGRTGRALSRGTALSVLSEEESRRLGMFTSQLGVKIPSWQKLLKPHQQQ